MPDNTYRPEGDPLGGSTQVPGTDDMAAVTPVGITIVDGDEDDDEDWDDEDDWDEEDDGDDGDDEDDEEDEED